MRRVLLLSVVAACATFLAVPAAHADNPSVALLYGTVHNGTTGGAWSTANRSVNNFDGDRAMVSSGASNDSIKWGFTLASGTYTIRLSHSRGNNRGIYTFTLDGASVGTIDGYTAAADEVAIISDIASVTVTGEGAHQLTVAMTTKNASSSSYYAVFSYVGLMRSAPANATTTTTSGGTTTTSGGTTTTAPLVGLADPDTQAAVVLVTCLTAGACFGGIVLRVRR